MSIRPRVFAMLLAALLAASGLASELVRLTILHTNDTHGHLLPFSYPASTPGDEATAGLSSRRDIGGIARRATLVKRVREELKGQPVWLIDMGDICDGTAFSTEYHGEADTAAMNALGYDFGVFGNHEFNNNLTEMRKVIAATQRRLLCANAIDRSTGKPLVPPSTVVKIGGLRVGLFGLVTYDAHTYPAAKEGVDVLKELDAAKAAVADLRKSCDVVVLLSHMGFDVDKRVAKEVPGIDVILGGHSHSRLPVGDLEWWSDELKPEQVNGTVIVQAGQWGAELGRLDLLFAKDAQKKWHVERYHARLLPITKALPEDPKVAEVVKGFWDPIAPKYGVVLGEATSDIAERGDDLANYNLVADAIRETFGTDVEFENLGGVRAPLLQGPITIADVATIDPFNNTIVTFKLTGKQLKQVLARYRPAVSGVKYRIEHRKLIEASVNGAAIEDDKTYTGSANSYFAGYALREFGCQDTGKARFDTIVEYIRSKKTLGPTFDGRRVVIE